MSRIAIISGLIIRIGHFESTLINLVSIIVILTICACIVWLSKRELLSWEILIRPCRCLCIILLLVLSTFKSLREMRGDFSVTIGHDCMILLLHRHVTVIVNTALNLGAIVQILLKSRIVVVCCSNREGLVRAGLVGCHSSFLVSRILNRQKVCVS